MVEEIDHPMDEVDYTRAEALHLASDVAHSLMMAKEHDSHQKLTQLENEYSDIEIDTDDLRASILLDDDGPVTMSIERKVGSEGKNAWYDIRVVYGPYRLYPTQAEPGSTETVYARGQSHGENARIYLSDTDDPRRMHSAIIDRLMASSRAISLEKSEKYDKKRRMEEEEEDDDDDEVEMIL